MKKETQGYCVGGAESSWEKKWNSTHTQSGVYKGGKQAVRGKIADTSYVSITCACNKPGAGIVSWKLVCNIYFARAPLHRWVSAVVCQVRLELRRFYNDLDHRVTRMFASARYLLRVRVRRSLRGVQPS